LKKGEGFWVSYLASSLYLTVSHSLVQTPCVSRKERVKGRTGKRESKGKNGKEGEQRRKKKEGDDVREGKGCTFQYIAAWMVRIAWIRNHPTAGVNTGGL
jgi:hypothetical protein